MRAIILPFFVLVVSFTAIAQQSAPANIPAVADAKLHQDVAKLVELMGVRQRMEDSREKMVQAGKENILREFPSYDPAFSDEWAKRMRARIKIDDFVEVVISVYEKHFNDNEIEELTQAQMDSNGKKLPILSPHLKEKLNAIAITVQSEILGGCGQVGAKLGGEIGQQIGQEHPDWIKQPKSAGK